MARRLRAPPLALRLQRLLRRLLEPRPLGRDRLLHVRLMRAALQRHRPSDRVPRRLLRVLLDDADGLAQLLALRPGRRLGRARPRQVLLDLLARQIPRRLLRGCEHSLRGGPADRGLPRVEGLLRRAAHLLLQHLVAALLRLGHRVAHALLDGRAHLDLAQRAHVARGLLDRLGLAALRLELRVL